MSMHLLSYVKYSIRYSHVQETSKREKTCDSVLLPLLVPHSSFLEDIYM